MIRKRTKVNENDVEDQNKSSMKQLGSPNKSFMRNASPALSLKTNQRDQKMTNLNAKQKFQIFKDNKTVPQKRTLVNQEEAQAKKHHTVERTYRRREEEIEWSPVGLDLDFSGLDSSVREYNKEPAFVEPEPMMERRFDQMKETVTQEQEEVTEEEEEDMTTVEYAPPKEKEIPYGPDPSCIVDLSGFSPFADQDAYEFSRFQKLPYQRDDWIDVEEEVNPFVATIDEFDYSDLEPESDLTADNDFSSIPFQDHQLDVDYYVQMHC